MNTYMLRVVMSDQARYDFKTIDIPLECDEAIALLGGRGPGLVRVSVVTVGPVGDVDMPMMELK